MSACLISAVKAFWMVKSSCKVYLVYVVNTRITNNTIKHISVVNEIPDVFSDDLLGLSPDREVEFAIEFIPGEAPISISLYRMAPVELKEL